MKNFLDMLRDAGILVQYGMGVASYWNPLNSPERDADKKERQKIQRRKKLLIIRSIIIWGFMIWITWTIYGQL